MTDKQEATDQKSEQDQTERTYSPIEAAVLTTAESLKGYASRVSADVDKAREWDNTLATVMVPIRHLMDNLDKATGPSGYLTNAAIVDTREALENLDIKDVQAGIAQWMTFNVILRDNLRPGNVAWSEEEDKRYAKEYADLLGVLDNALIRLTLGEEVQAVADTAKASYLVAMSKYREWALASKRAVPSKVGGSGSSGASQPKSDKMVNVVFVSETGLKTYTTRNGGQPRDKVGHAIKEKMVEVLNVRDVPSLPETVKTDILDALDKVADGENQVIKAGIGTFTAK